MKNTNLKVSLTALTILVMAYATTPTARTHCDSLEGPGVNAAARELADLYFFEALVRVHRAGEGASYTGLKRSGTDLGPAIPASDKTLATGDVEAVLKLFSEKTEHGVREHFQEALDKK